MVRISCRRATEAEARWLEERSLLAESAAAVLAASARVVWSWWWLGPDALRYLACKRLSEQEEGEGG